MNYDLNRSVVKEKMAFENVDGLTKRRLDDE